MKTVREKKKKKKKKKIIYALKLCDLEHYSGKFRAARLDRRISLGRDLPDARLRPCDGLHSGSSQRLATKNWKTEANLAENG